MIPSVQTVHRSVSHTPLSNIVKDLKLTNQFLLCRPTREQQRQSLSKAGGLGWRAEAGDSWVGLGRGHRYSPWRLIFCKSQVSGASAEDTQKSGEVSQTGMERSLGKNLTQSPMFSTNWPLSKWSHLPPCPHHAPSLQRPLQPQGSRCVRGMQTFHPPDSSELCPLVFYLICHPSLPRLDFTALVML